MNIYVESFIKEALLEDMGMLGDITTDSIFGDESKSVGVINFREEAILGGIDFAMQVFKTLDPEISIEVYKKDGDKIAVGENVMTIRGKTKAILKGERLALNLMQRISGIATATNTYVKKVEKYGVKIADTRKTTPLFRYFEKYGVKTGGGINHRFGLYDAVLIKDNHIAAAGGITIAIEKAKKNVSHTTKIEIEVEDYAGAKEALAAGADIIMLDNMRGDRLRECVELLKGKVITEASGNVNLENIEDVAKSGIDIISTGSIVYNAKNIDIGLDFIVD